MFETLRFLRKYLPGFENAVLISLSPYISARGGRSIESEYVITAEDALQARKFDDAVYRFGEPKYNDEMFEVPYRLLLPKRVEGLLAAGRSAHRKLPNLRGRWSAMLMGQIAGLAAALAARQNIFPRWLNVRALQQALLDIGLQFVPPQRVEELFGHQAAPAEPAPPIQDLGQV